MVPEKLTFTVDIEPTNRCNAKCHFCPRDATPHQGLMSAEIFERALARTVDYRDMVDDVFGAEVVVSLCGLGEPFLNRHTPDFVRQVRDAGFQCTMSSNGALLTEDRARAVLDAGLQEIFLNVGDTDEEYEEVYKLPFERTRDNVVRFREMAGDDCKVSIVLVDYRRDRPHLDRMRAYWRELGLTDFVTYNIMNRGGALFVDHMEYESYPELAEAQQMLTRDGRPALCAAPFAYLFVGYDGNYYLCCSDWKKEVPLGSVLDASFVSVMQGKLEHVRGRESVCKTCNLDPVNVVTEELRALDAGETDATKVEALVDRLQSSSVDLVNDLERLEAADPEDWWSRRPAPSRKLIPVRAE